MCFLNIACKYFLVETVKTNMNIAMIKADLRSRKEQISCEETDLLLQVKVPEKDQ